MKKKVFESVKKYIDDYKDFDDVRLCVDNYLSILLRKNPRSTADMLLKRACIEYVADGNMAMYPSDQFNDLVEIYTQAGEKFRYEVYLKKDACDEIKKFGFDEWFQKYNHLDEHYEHFKQKGSEFLVTLWYREIIGTGIYMMYLNYDK